MKPPQCYPKARGMRQEGELGAYKSRRKLWFPAQVFQVLGARHFNVSIGKAETVGAVVPWLDREHLGAAADVPAAVGFEDHHGHGWGLNLFRFVADQPGIEGVMGALARFA